MASPPCASPPRLTDKGSPPGRGAEEERSDYPMPLMTSLYTQARLHPATAAGLAAGGVALAALALRIAQQRR